MSLANLLSAEQIIPEMKATERWSAIVELIDLLVSLGKIKPADREPILAALRQRELPYPIVHPIGSTKWWRHLEGPPKGSSSTRWITRQ